MNAKLLRVVVPVALLIAGSIITPVVAADAPQSEHRSRRPQVVQMPDARLKFEINATDGDGGVQAFIDADPWKRMSIFDPHGRRIFTSTTKGRMARQGGTELFLESGEPPFDGYPSTNCSSGSRKEGIGSEAGDSTTRCL